MATSYANTGGSGDRTSIITITSNGIAEYGAGWTHFVDGAQTDESWWGCNLPLTQIAWLKFDFGSGASKVIDECKFYQSDTTSHAEMRWQGSDNNSDWTNIGGIFRVGGAATQTQTELSGNATGYRYYRLLATSDNYPMSASPYIREFEFKIDDAGGTASIIPQIMNLRRQFSN